MDLVILDLEWNTAYSKELHGFLNEIIEFGAVKCGEDLVKRDSFSTLVKPQVGKRMNTVAKQLTNLTLETLAHGVSFQNALRQFARWAGDCVVLTWGTSDILTLIENCRYFCKDEHIPFLGRYCDLQQYVQKRLGTSGGEQLGLARAAELLGLDLSDMEHHRALDDSLMTLEILRQTFDAQELASFVQECDEEFYRRITFKTVYITDLHHPPVQKSDLRFRCPKCGEQAKKKSAWRQRNKSFHAEFRCPNCGHSFTGRLTIKEKYEGLSVNKKTTPLPVIEAPRALTPGPVGQMRAELVPVTDEDKVREIGVLRFPAWDGISCVNAAFTTRVGGKSEKEFAALNLGFGRGDDEQTVAENVRLFCLAAGFDSESLVAGAQEHHTNVRRVGKEQCGIGFWRERDMTDIDGLCTNEPGVTLVVYCADCVPLYFVDERHRAIGLAHAGWRGTVAGMAEVMVERMHEEFGTNPADLKVCVGPSICADCFEVDAPVAEEFLQLTNAERFVTGPVELPGQDGVPIPKYHVDLWECNRQWLLSAGVPAEGITVGEVCTMCESDLLFSHRKTCGKRGSNCAMLALTE